MVELNYEFFWQEALNQMLEEIGEQEFNRWFALVEYRSHSENVVTLVVPSNFYREEVKRRYKTSLEAKLRLISDQDVVVEFEVGVVTPQIKAKEDYGKKQAERPLAPREEPTKPTPAPAAQPTKAKKPPHPHLRLSYNFDNFVIGVNNSFAANAALAVTKNPDGAAYNPLFLYGGVGLGKTHLTQAIGNYLYAHTDLKIIYTSAENFLNELVDSIGDKKATNAFKNKYRYTDVLLMDDIHFLQGNKGATQEELFHTFNALYDSNKQIVFTSDRPASELKHIPERLISRFGRGLNVDLSPPDYETRCAILKRKAEAKKADIPDDVIALLSKNISSNVRDLEGAFTKLVAYAELAGRKITVEVAQQQLKDVFASPKQANMSIDVIIKVIAEYHQLSSSDLKGKKRSQKIVTPRQIAMFISHEITEFSTTEIGQNFGGRDHTTVMHSCNKIKEKMQADPKLDTTVQKLVGLIKEHTAKSSSD
ncbi:MAG: chromosomal replication initiator protein DnaA [Treponema sp.]|jgi:chromosomal replication initiator protein|nr:chromosomal replication initiator protein DnaA [Treponema sp.]